MPRVIRIQKTCRLRLYPTRTALRVRLMGIGLLIGGLFLTALGAFWPAPKWERTRRDSGRFADVQWFTSRSGGQRLGLWISGTCYVVYDSPAAMDSLAGALRRGEELEVWSTPLPLGRREVWQLSRGKEPLASFDHFRKLRAETDHRTVVAGEVFLIVGMLFLGASWLLSRLLARLAGRTAGAHTMGTSFVIRTGTDDGPGSFPKQGH